MGVRSGTFPQRSGALLHTGIRTVGRLLSLLGVGVFGNAASVLVMVLERARANARLVAATTLGLVISVALVSAIPLYADGISEKLLHERLQSQTDQAQPPASLLFHWVFNSNSPNAAPSNATPPPPVSQYWAANNYLEKNGPSAVDLPLQQGVRYGATDKLPVYALGQRTVANGNQFKNYLAIGFLSDLQQHIVITQGKFPDHVFDSQHNVEGLMTQAGAEKYLINVGDVVTFANQGAFQAVPIKVRIVGTWRPKNPNEPYWFYRPDTFNDYVLVPEQNYFNGVLKVNPNAEYEYYWFFIFNQRDIHSTNAAQVISGSQQLTATASSLMSGITLDISPVKVLEQFETDSYFLKILLFALSVPTLAIVLYYILLASTMLIDRQRNEIAVLKSRGASNIQVLGIYVVEGGFFGAVALVLGPLIGGLVAQFIGFTYTFLVFVNRGLLPVRLSSDTYRYALAAVGLSFFAMLLPAAAAARYTIIGYKAEVARSSRKPFWQRYFLDFAVLGVAIYGYKLLQQNGSLLAISQSGSAVQDPVLLLVPAFFMFALALVGMRVFPILSEAVARLSHRVAPLWMLLAFRQISRTPSQYTRLVLLVTLTMSLGIFSASMAQTLDQNVSDHLYYQNGADLTFLERGEYDQVHQVWNIEPIQRYQGLKGILGATRMLVDSKATVVTTAGHSSGTVQLVAIDPYTYASYGWYRHGLNAPETENDVLSMLRSEDDAVVVSSSFMSKNHLSPGQTILVTVGGNTTPVTTIPLVLKGTVNVWPTVYPQDGDFFLVNIDYVLGIEGQQPWTVLLKLAPGASPTMVRNELANLPEYPIYEVTDTQSEIFKARSLPETTGLFGTLTVGFLVATLLTVMGFLLYSFLSYQRRMQQFGIMRAIGLSVWGLVAMLGFEQLFLIFLGVGLGTVIGRYASSLFIPFLHIDLDSHANVPPFLVHTPWDQVFKLYTVLAIMLILALPVMIGMLLRMRIYEATKLGEEQG
ncbi:MAG: FtsX-like permease family protein [Chloroflexi bacterium]|nr:FtsX-like permease family protein [Chloroflexota bacterium]